MARWGCGWPRPVARARPGWTVPCSCPTTGGRSARAVRARASPRRRRVRRRRRGRASGSPARATRRGQRPGCRAIACRGRIGGGWGWRPRSAPPASRGRGTRRSGRVGSTATGHQGWPPSRQLAGPGAGPAWGPRAAAGMRGAGGPGPLPSAQPGAAGCGAGGVSAIPRPCRPPSCWRPTRALWRPWCGWPGAGGPWRAAVRQRQARGGWLRMPCAGGRGGSGRAPGPGGRRRGGRSCRPPPGHQRRPKKHGCPPRRAAWRPARPREGGWATAWPRESAALLTSGAGHAAASGTDAGLVEVAPLASRPRPRLAR